MPAWVHLTRSGRQRLAELKRRIVTPPAKFQERSSRCLTIGLVNNMPDGALKATERQFLSLLDAASGDLHVRLVLYALPGIPRKEASGRHVKNFYTSTETLWNKHLDGLIVTGREPLTPDLTDEPYWKGFMKLLDWAQDHTDSTVWSCLAAHAAVLHMSGIQRMKTSDKRSGVFECIQVCDHPLLSGAPPQFRLPHSRWNDLPEDDLTHCGYSVLTRTRDASVDTFIKQQNSLFVFFQGHPEYESNTILREYRRDVGRYLRGESDTYPTMPRSYFDLPTLSTLTALREEATCRRRNELLAEVSSVLGRRTIENTWRTTAVSLYKNWLEYLSVQKKSRLGNKNVSSNVPGGSVRRS